MTEEEMNAIDHEIIMEEELISRDEVITLIALKHLSKEENFHGAITQLNRQVKKLKTVTIKAEIAEILDKISAEIDEKISHYEHFSSSNTANGLMIAKDIIEKYKAESEDKEC